MEFLNRKDFYFYLFIFSPIIFVLITSKKFFYSVTIIDKKYTARTQLSVNGSHL